MKKIIYSSKAVDAFSKAALVDLLEQARKRNQAAGISGMLIYADSSFLQIMEGEADAVDALFGRIRLDPRHRDIRLLCDKYLSKRRFGQWSMGFAHQDRDWMMANIEGYRPTHEYPLSNDSLLTSAEEAEGLLHFCAVAP